MGNRHHIRRHVPYRSAAYPGTGAWTLRQDPRTARRSCRAPTPGLCGGACCPPPNHTGPKPYRAKPYRAKPYRAVPQPATCGALLTHKDRRSADVFAQTGRSAGVLYGRRKAGCGPRRHAAPHPHTVWRPRRPAPLRAWAAPRRAPNLPAASAASIRSAVHNPAVPAPRRRSGTNLPPAPRNCRIGRKILPRGSQPPKVRRMRPDAGPGGPSTPSPPGSASRRAVPSTRRLHAD